jgi:monoamine oxidase
MAHYSIARLLKSAFHAAVQEDAETVALFNDYQESRRKFLKQMALAAGGLAITPSVLSLASCNKNEEQIAIIGAGIAGLNAAYQLQKQGIKATIYEASDRIGGRMYTIRNEFGKDLTTDIGGEFVDTTHSDIIQLVKELGLSFYDLRQDKLARKVFHFGGKQFNDEDLKKAIKPYAAQLMKDIKSLPVIISYKESAKFRHLDQQSITGYLKSIGINGWLYDFLNLTLTREYGMEASQQSAVNFLIMFTDPVDSEKGYELFGTDHEVFKIKGGSQHLTDALYQKVKDSVKTGYNLKAINKETTDGYDLLFDQNGKNTTVNTRKVIIAIPFTILRLITINVPMPPAKIRCINEIGYGNSSKFVLGVTNKPWRGSGNQGYTFTDLSFGCGWDSSQMQSDRDGSFTIFGGGDFSDMVFRENEEKLVDKFLPDLDTIYPGTKKAFSKKTMKFCWVSNPYSKAAYSAFKTGQWSTIAGWEAVPVEQIYFAGEHVSSNFQGYMNGAAQTGRMAVELMMKSIDAGA